MTSEKWQKVKEVFNAVLELPANERRELVENCDESLREDVLALLDSHEESENFIETSVLAVADFVTSKPASSMVGKQIGVYKIIEEVGRGGMGAVYLAERADGEFEQKVAVKLIKRGLDTDEIIRRFRHERQILAALNHPFITRLLDGGTTEDGLPFLVMDYVEGTPLTEFSGKNNLDLNERLKLFLQICSAVTYAHRNLIIHRDLKPSNILVTADGTPRLLDFGIAKLLQENGATTLGQTATAWQAMTPEYASPEQIRGENITTSTDIYSLGVVLYELLTGVRPFYFPNRRPDEITRIITDSAPLRPSDAVTRGRGDAGKKYISPSNVSASSRVSLSASQIKGDLDNIVLMAMRKEPERRYSSVEQLAEDIRRFLEGLPVIAQEDTFGYRAGKFVKRNKTLVAAAAGIGISLVAGIAATLRQADKARRQRDKAERINDFLKKMLNSPDPRAQGKDVKVVEVLEIAAQSIENDFAAQPEIAADLRTTIGLTYFSLGLYDTAEPHLKAAMQIRKRFFGSEHQDTALSLNHYARLLHAKGDFNEAEPLYRQSLAVLRRLCGSKHLDVAKVLNNLGYILLLKGRHEEGLRAHREELEIRRALLGENHPDVARSLSSLGNALSLIGDKKAAESLHRRALKIMRRFHGDEHPDTALMMIDLLGAIKENNPVEAEQLGLEVLSIRRKILGENHPDIAWSYYNLAYLKMEAGDFAEAERRARQALAMRGALLPDEHPAVSSSLLTLGRSLIAQNRIGQAEEVLLECLDLRRRTLPPDHWLLDSTKGFLGECAAHKGETDKARNLILSCYENLKSKLGAEHEQTRFALARLTQFFPK